MRIFLAVALLCILATPASSHEIDCELVRAKIAEHGKARAIIWARQQGYSWADIWRVRKQCKV